MNSLASSASVENCPRCCPVEATTHTQGQERLSIITALGLDSSQTVPAFEEALQLVIRFLQSPMGWVSVVGETTEHLKAAYGLSSLGLGNRLATERQLPLAHSLSTYVLESRQPLVIPDTAQLPSPAQRDLVTTYGVAAFCAVPLMTAQGQCIGVLTVMDSQPQSFTEQEVSFLAMAARWGMAEYERTLRSTSEPSEGMANQHSPVDAVRLHLISQLIQDLRNPLTAVLGMTSMLSREIYGPLTEKQREYVEIVHSSSQTLMTQVDEIIDLGLIDPEASALVPTPIDISRLGQQVMTTLDPLAEKLSQSLELTVEPEQGLWILDQHTVKQILYHAVFSLMHMASENSTIRVHGSRKGQSLSLSIWVANPWLGEALPPSTIRLCQALAQSQYHSGLAADTWAQDWFAGEITPAALSKHWLGLVLCQHLAEHHGGKLQLHGSDDTGYRLVISLASLRNLPPSALTAEAHPPQPSFT